MSSQAIQLIKSRLNIVDVVRRYVELRPMSGRWVAPCPFHQETKPSFSVNEHEGFFYCFGCQASGDVLDFYSRINGLEFRETLEILAEEAGVDLGDSKPDPHAAERKKQKKVLLDMHKVAAEHFSRNLGLHAGQIARDYMGRRGVSAEMVQEFGLGYGLDDWHGLDNFLQSKGFTPEQGVEAGLLSKNEKGNIYDRFRGRLIFPIQNLSGQVIAFGGRIITDGEPKYLNSSDSPIYKKGEHLYGLYQARRAMTRTKRALLTEGYTDVLSLHQFGYADACGVLGTALTMEQVRRLSGFCSRVDLVFDGDAPGRKAALRSAEMILLAGVRVKVILLPEGEDVDSLLQSQGRDGFEVVLEKAADGLDFALETVRNEYAPKEIVGWAKTFLGKLDDQSLRAYYLPRLSIGLGLAEDELRQAAPQKVPGPASAPMGQPAGREPVRRAPATGMEEKHDRYFLKFPLQYPEYVGELQKRGFHYLLSTQWAHKLWESITAHAGTDLIVHLAEEDKRFFVECRMELENDNNVLSGQELLEEWHHICAKIETGRVRKEKDELIQALRNAQAAGDEGLVEQCMKALNEFVGRTGNNEQH